MQVYRSLARHAELKIKRRPKVGSRNHIVQFSPLKHPLQEINKAFDAFDIGETDLVLNIVN